MTSIREIYARYAGPVYTVAMSRLHDRHLAEESVQDTFVKAWRGAANFDPARGLAPWLYAIARRAAADIARREGRRPPAVPEGAAGSDPLVHHDPALDEAWEAWQVRTALAELPSDDRELLRLAHYAGLTHTEIADRLRLPVGTVKSRTHRAHRRLADRLAHLRAAP